MSYFIPVKYKDLEYPNHIKPKIEEISANFNVERINPTMDNYSLHTEYSFGSRKWDNPLLDGLDAIKNAHSEKIPLLWFNEKWSEEFSTFVKRLSTGHKDPKIIEVHPPFKDYCATMDEFVKVYKVFEEKILDRYPNTQIVIENRIGSLYKQDKVDFVLQKSHDFIQLSELIDKNNLNLKMVLDLPQLLYSERDKEKFLDISNEKDIQREITNSLNTIKSCRHNIVGLHVWGQKEIEVDKNGDKVKEVRPHFGDLNTFFTSNELKQHFLNQVLQTFNDGKSRYFVPEVNSGREDGASVINDFVDSGFEFI